ncbi:hypothetical protein BZA77DRAFT_353674 [Pyronema omphalodes]|nr:hypothetical protein BZA77DRAFT_353674 [Pyronema omphalodes]
MKAFLSILILALSAVPGVVSKKKKPLGPDELRIRIRGINGYMEMYHDKVHSKKDINCYDLDRFYHNGVRGLKVENGCCSLYGDLGCHKYMWSSMHPKNPDLDRDDYRMVKSYRCNWERGCT